MSNETIYALASGRDAASIAVFRLSGPHALEIAARLTRAALPSPQSFALRTLIDPTTGGVVDEVLVLVFAEGRSYTGEPSVELHCHAGGAVVEQVQASLEVLGARLAEPGEFTLRRYRSGRIDLAQAEAVAALTAAETKAQQQQALRVLDGAVGRQADAWRRDLIALAGLLEASIDFAEEDIETDTLADALALATSLRRTLIAEVKHLDHDERALSKPLIALIGAPNAGKSSVMNLLAGRDAAIVTPVAGTTRDVLHVPLRAGAVSLEAVDTAGLRHTNDEVERIGVQRARDVSERADLRLVILSADTIDALPELSASIRSNDIVVWNKVDLAPPPDTLRTQTDGVPVIAMSAIASEPPSELLLAIENAALQMTRVTSPIAGSGRRRRLVEEASAHVSAAQEKISRSQSESAIEEVRAAMRSVNRLTGEIDHEHVLDEVFSRFCIGK